MRISATPLPGAFVIEPEPRTDDRGFFARQFCARELERLGFADTAIMQVNTSYSRLRGTLRGMHYQLPPSAETKYIRCIAGTLHDVIVDLRVGSPTYLRWHGTVLSAENRHVLVVPKGFAHGFITLTDDVEILYFVTARYDAAAERGLRWDDPAIGIEWPMTPTRISDKDASHPGFVQGVVLP